MKITATWNHISWFYYAKVLVLIYKSDKNRYKYEIFADGCIHGAEHPFRTEAGAVKAAKDFINNQISRGFSPEPLNFEELLARREKASQLKRKEDPC